MKYKILLLFGLVFMIGCSTTKQPSNVAAHYEYEVECMGTGMDGTQLMKVWGYGRKAPDAIEQAKKNAVHAVIFKGIKTGKIGCRKNPLVTKPGVEQQHKDYFNSFFAPKGKYLKFVSISNDRTIRPGDRIKSGKGYKIGVIVSVEHTALRKELEAAGIITSLENL
jgi:hypothetical protein